jgi:hypothetical protein
MKYKKKARKGALHAVETKLVALLHIVVIVGLIIGAMIDMVEFVKYKYEKAFPSPHTMTSELANPKKSRSQGGRKPNWKRRHRGVDSRGAP